MTTRPLPAFSGPAAALVAGCMIVSVGHTQVSDTHRASSPLPQIEGLIRRMTTEQKLGQMMIVQFTGPYYSPAIAAMINRYLVGAVILYASNDNIRDREQLRLLIAQMQNDSAVPLLVATDQEGGTVDRLQSIDGMRPSAASIGATDDPANAKLAGAQTESELSALGFNLNIAPVVDVTNVPNQQLAGRTFGGNADIVTRMAAAYLQGLQGSRKVFGVLKHFPGLGSIGTDPHSGVAVVERPRQMLEAIDWAPYRALIAARDAHAIMVTHEVVRAVDATMPSSLSAKIVTGILRGDLAFRGVVMTDSLTMNGVTAFAKDQAAVLAIAAGDDLLMGASSPEQADATVATIERAIAAHKLSTARIDESVRRILTLKYQLGLLAF
jgi:beta-N-acetylhexosaminidase